MEKVKVHRFRHTFATRAIENETRELDVQYWLGRSSPIRISARALDLFSATEVSGELA